MGLSLVILAKAIGAWRNGIDLDKSRLDVGSGQRGRRVVHKMQSQRCELSRVDADASSPRTAQDDHARGAGGRDGGDARTHRAQPLGAGALGIEVDGAYSAAAQRVMGIAATPDGLSFRRCSTW